MSDRVCYCSTWIERQPCVEGCEGWPRACKRRELLGPVISSEVFREDELRPVEWIRIEWDGEEFIVPDNVLPSWLTGRGPDDDA